MQRIRHLLEMIRFSHTVFALPFALLGAVLAWYVQGQGEADTGAAALAAGFSWKELLAIVLCMVTARSAAMSFNRIADWRIDADNPRTASRHIPAGTLSAGSVIWFAVVNAVAFVLATLLFLPNWLPIALSAPVLLFLLGYSYTKRFTALAHFWLGLALMLAPISAWIAIRGTVLLAEPLDLLPAVILGAAVMLWVAGFDIIYACQDADFDRQAKLHSVPSAIGIPAALRVAAGCHAAMFAVFLLLPSACPQLGLGWIYWLGATALGVLLCIEHWLVRPGDLRRVNAAFFQVNAVISIGLFLLVTADLLVGG